MEKKIDSADYCSYMKNAMNSAVEADRKAEAEYCAMHYLMILECNSNKQGIGRIEYSEIQPEKEDYEKAVSLLQNQQLEYKKKDRKDLIISVVAEVFVFAALYKIAGISLVLSLTVVMILLAAELILNTVTKKQRFSRWQTKKYETSVSRELIEYNSRWLKGGNQDVDV